MHTAEIGTKLHDCAMVPFAARSAPISLYTTSLLGVVQEGMALKKVYEFSALNKHGAT